MCPAAPMSQTDRVEASQYSVVPLQFHRTADSAGSQAPSSKRRFSRRRGDRSQLMRHSVQGAFLLLNLWVGVRFYFFVRFYEAGGQGPAIARPPGVEGWLPIAGLM